MLGSLFAPMVLHSLPSFLTPAYLDPGTGSLIIQAAVGAIVAAGLALKVYWFKIQDFFGKKPAVTADAASAQLAQDPSQSDASSTPANEADTYSKPQDPASGA